MRIINQSLASMLVTCRLRPVVCVLLVFVAFGPESLPAHGSLDQQQQHISHRISRHPHDHESLLERAQIHLRLGNEGLAINDIRAAAKISDETEVAYMLGLYHHASNDHRAAIAAFGDYLVRYPEHIPAIHNRAKCHLALGLTAQSISDYERLLNASAQHSPDYYLELARAQSSLEAAGIDLALKSLDRGMQQLGVLASLQTAAIRYEINRGNYRMAMARHATLKPWLGRTSQWRLRRKQLARNLMTAGDETAAKEPIQP